MRSACSADGANRRRKVSPEKLLPGTPQVATVIVWPALSVTLWVRVVCCALFVLAAEKLYELSWISAVMSLLVSSPVSVWRKQEFMIEPPTVAVLGVPGIRVAPMPASPSSPPLPQLMDRL